MTRSHIYTLHAVFSTYLYRSHMKLIVIGTTLKNACTIAVYCRKPTNVNYETTELVVR